MASQGWTSAPYSSSSWVYCSAVFHRLACNYELQKGQNTGQEPFPVEATLHSRKAWVHLAGGVPAVLYV